MSIEDNKAVARRWSEELWNGANLAVADEIVAPDYVRHDGGDPVSAHGPAGVKQLVTRIRAMMPDLQIVIEDLISEGDKVVSRYATVATDTQGFMGRPPMGKRFGRQESRSSELWIGRLSRVGPSAMI